MFNKQQIIKEVQQVQSGEISPTDSTVYQEWAELAESWIMNDVGEYILNGFKGFNERSTKEIIEDFLLSDKIYEQEIQVISDDECKL